MVEVLLNSLYSYYTDEKKIKSFLDVIGETNNKISLRIIDWFVTNYSKKYNISYMIYRRNDGSCTFNNGGDNVFHKHFNTYQSYKSQLKSFSKKKFDPFCRRQRIDFEYKHNQKVETTVGQLNFFKWAIDNLIIEYILNNYLSIENDMNQSYNQIKKHKKKSNERKKRQELSKSATRGLNNTNIRVILDFD